VNGRVSQGMLFDLSSQAARSARALSETMVARTIHMA
jgi:hypothetical protein